MTLPLHKDPHKKQMVEWWLKRAMPDTYGNRSEARRLMLRWMISAEKAQDPNAGAEALYELARETGRAVTRTCGYWGSEGDYCEPALCVRGYYADRGERWDLCWTGAQWEFDVKEERRRYW